MDITAGEVIYLQRGSSSMVMDGETDIRASRVKLDELTKRPVFVVDLEPVPEPPLMSIQAYQAALVNDTLPLSINQKQPIHNFKRFKEKREGKL
ncbi:hypothetical protein [Paenibacillus polymyxa]|uniref:hypothetical protein n=1 Tax=Paenibacillus TaxID=44249 RepID=UPI002AB4E6EE|nr:hypothetical protein [Paenibacillus polymyxa]MDY8091443.1 hypothetical protein [Paenibacillus polymyxa]